MQQHEYNKLFLINFYINVFKLIIQIIIKIVDYCLIEFLILKKGRFFLPQTVQFDKSINIYIYKNKYMFVLIYIYIYKNKPNFETRRSY